MRLSGLIKRAIKTTGFEIRRVDRRRVEGEDRRILEAVRETTMIGEAGVLANLDAVRYVVANQIEGAIVECGVWKGGSMRAMLEALRGQQAAPRAAYLFDTFRGMTAPSDVDVDSLGARAANKFTTSQRAGHNDWCYAPREFVEEVIRQSGHPADLVSFVEGDVLETLPRVAPTIGPVAILRLDTDWYESTKAELEWLFPKVPIGGVVLLDDFGHWAGARKAVDEYFEKHRIRPLLSRVDYSRRMMVKTHGPVALQA